MAEDLIELLDDKVEETLSSGVTVSVLPFPARLFLRIQEEAEKRFPDLVPPQKTIEVLDGTEEVDDLNDPDYVVEQKTVEAARAAWMSEKVLDVLLKFCIEVDLSKHEGTIRALEETLWEFPTNGVERKLEFLSSYAARTKPDYDRLILASLGQTTVDDEEVAQRLASFQDHVERATTGDTETPGAAEG